MKTTKLLMVVILLPIIVWLWRGQSTAAPYSPARETASSGLSARDEEMCADFYLLLARLGYVDDQATAIRSARLLLLDRGVSAADFDYAVEVCDV